MITDLNYSSLCTMSFDHVNGFQWGASQTICFFLCNSIQFLTQPTQPIYLIVYDISSINLNITQIMIKFADANLPSSIDASVDRYNISQDFHEILIQQIGPNFQYIFQISSISPIGAQMLLFSDNIHARLTEMDA